MASTSSSPPEETALVRHIIPVLIGGALAALLTFVTDNTLGAHGMLPADGESMPGIGALLFAAAYRGVFAILGCHMAARLAPPGNPRIRYALALGGLMMVMGIFFAVSNWGKVPSWYLIGSIAMTLPYAIIGGGTAARVMAGAAR
jgi:hypothetical protein